MEPNNEEPHLEIVENGETLKDEQKPNNALSEEDQAMVQNFMSKPFVFTPPPLISDPTTTAYRESLTNIMGPITDHYQMFNRNFDLETGANFENGEQPKNVLGKSNHSKEESLKIKVLNFKFMAYTLYSSIIDFFKVFKGDELNKGEKIKMSHALTKKKIVEFYNLANDLKENYRRIEVLHMLDNEIKELDKETIYINKQIKDIENYIQNNSIIENNLENNQ